MTRATVRLTMAQALVRYLCNQFTESRRRAGSAVCRASSRSSATATSPASREALEAVKDTLPTWRGQNEQSMALAAIGFAKAKRRRQIMVAASSIGPGASNMVTAAGVAHSNRLPVLLLAGDTFVNRRPDPVMQQVEHFGDPTINVNDAFKAVTRYWDRIVHPEQIIALAAAGGGDDARSGRLRPGLHRSAQDSAGDRLRLSGGLLRADRHGRSPGRGPTATGLPRPCELLEGREAAADHLGRRRALFAAPRRLVASSPLERGIPIAETIAGKGAVTHDHPAHVGPIGIVGSTSANALAAEADVVLAIGTRLMDFTTGSWTVFATTPSSSSINAARWDATKHRALAVVGDARETVAELDAALGDWKAASRPGPRTAAS